MTIHRIGSCVLLAAMALAAGPSIASDEACVDALYQLEVLRIGTRVFKPGPGDERNFLHDRDRPAEVERLTQLAEQHCSTDPTRRQAQAASASKLVVALSPDCAAARERLATLERPDSRSSPDTVERQRQYVTDNCPDLSRNDVWIADRVLTPRIRP
jgi:hypothetical protein